MRNESRSIQRDFFATIPDDDEESDDDWEIEETGELIRSVLDVFKRLDCVEQNIPCTRIISSVTFWICPSQK